MEDSNDKTIDKIIYSVFSGLNWGSQQFKLTCPPRERWSWNKFWNWVNKSDKNKDEIEKQEENRKMQSHSKQSKEERNNNIEKNSSSEQNKNLQCGSQYCEIKMQDPCAACCCTIECIEPPTCTEVPRIDRTPRCECDKRKIIKTGPKCCDAMCFEVA